MIGRVRSGSLFVGPEGNTAHLGGGAVNGSQGVHWVGVPLIPVAPDRQSEGSSSPLRFRNHFVHMQQDVEVRRGVRLDLHQVGSLAASAPSSKTGSRSLFIGYKTGGSQTESSHSGPFECK